MAKGKLSKFKVNDKNVGFKILKSLYEDRYSGRLTTIAPINAKYKSRWLSILGEMKNLNYIEYEDYFLDTREGIPEKDRDIGIDIAPTPEGINTVRDTLEAKSRKIQNIISIILAALVVILTAINIWLSFKPDVP